MPLQLQGIKKFLPLIIAAVCGLVAMVLVNNYIQQKTEEEKSKVVSNARDQATVVVAKQDIASGETISESMIEEQTMHKNFIQPRAATSVDRVIDKVAMAPISSGEQVLLNKITMSSQETSLSMKVPQGKRAITIPVDSISSVGGMIRPGDHVDIVGMVPIPTMGSNGQQGQQMTSMPLFQDVLVLAVGQDFNSMGKKDSQAISTAITFALSPQEANLIVFVQEQGKIRLILRSPGDAQVQPVTPASWDTLFRTVMPQAFKPKPDAGVEQEEVPPVKAKKTVEIYRGLNKEIKDLE